MRFTVIDLETANARMHSICQLGIVVFQDGKELSATSTLIDPQDYFDGTNVSIHGIDESHVVGAKYFPEVYGWVNEIVRDEILVCHTHFDRVAMQQACVHHKIAPLTCRWLDSALVARRAWPQYSRQGYGLSNLAYNFEIQFRHHDALEDARTAGLILLRAIKETGTDLEGWFSRITQPLPPFGVSSGVGTYVNETGRFSGHSVVFTGRLKVVRAEAAFLARVAGMQVEDGVTKKTTLLIVGDQDATQFNGKNKSGKHTKAESLIAKGQPIRIIQETDFMALINEAMVT